MSVASGPSHSMDVGEPQRYSLRRGGERKRRGPKPKPQTASMSKYRRREANARYHIEEETYRSEGKGRRCCLGDVLECHTSHLAARMIWKKFLEEYPFWKGCWFGVVWTVRSSIFSKHPFQHCSFFYSSVSSNHPGAKYLAWQGIESTVPQNSSDDLCLLSCINPSSMGSIGIRQELQWK